MNLCASYFSGADCLIGLHIEGNLSQVCSVFHEIHCLYELTEILHIYHTKLWWIWLSSGQPANGLFLKLLGCISNHQSFVCQIFVILYLPRFVHTVLVCTMSYKGCALSDRHAVILPLYILRDLHIVIPYSGKFDSYL